MKTDFQDFILYLKSEKIVAQNTLEAYERDLKSLLAFLTIKKISSWQQVSQEEIMQFLSERRAKDYASSSLCRLLIVIKVFFKFLKREGAIKVNEIDLLQSPKIWQLVPEILSESEIHAFIEQPDRSTLIGARDRAILEVLYSVGLRVSELCALKLFDVDDHYVRIKGKGNKERIVPIGSKAIEAIDYYLCFRPEGGGAQTPLFLGKNNQPLHRITIWKLVKYYAKQAKIIKLSLLIPSAIPMQLICSIMEQI